MSSIMSTLDGDGQVATADWDRCKRPLSKSDVDGAGSHSSETRCPATTSSSDSGSGNGSGSNAAMGALVEENWSGADEGSNGKDEGQRQVDDDEEHPLPSLCEDRAVANSGNNGHPDACKPCAFYCFSLRGCRDDTNCKFCHLYHESKLRQRREDWKQSRRDKRQAKYATGGGRIQSKLASLAADADAWLMSATERTPPLPQASEVRGTSEMGALSRDCYDTATTIATTAFETAIVTVLEGGSKPVARVAYEIPEPQKIAPSMAMPAAAVAVGAGARTPTRHLGAPLPPHRSGTSPPSQPQQSAPLHVRLGQRYPNPILNDPVASGYDRLAPGLSPCQTSDGYPGHNVPVVTQQPPADIFKYTPNSAVIAVGQSLELWPPTNLITSDMVFAVSPELPPGLVLDERVGVIHGKPLGTTDDMVTYFITTCKADDLSASMQISKVTLKVIDISRAHNHEQSPAVTNVRSGTSSKKAMSRPMFKEKSDMKKFGPLRHGARQDLSTTGACHPRLSF